MFNRFYRVAEVGSTLLCIRVSEDVKKRWRRILYEKKKFGLKAEDIFREMLLLYEERRSGWSPP